MNHENLTLHYLTTEAELKEFWVLRDRYMVEDVIPNANPPITDEEKDWFFSKEYRVHMESLFWREENPLRFARLLQEGAYAGFISYIIYGNEDGKCFIVEYCVEKSRRGQGLGARFFQALEEEAKKKGAAYLALNVSNDRNRKFWMSQGFIEGEPDEYGNPIYFKGR